MSSGSLRFQIGVAQLLAAIALNAFRRLFSPKLESYQTQAMVAFEVFRFENGKPKGRDVQVKGVDFRVFDFGVKKSGTNFSTLS